MVAGNDLWSAVLFPARAGVIPRFLHSLVMPAPIPRTRGGDPAKYLQSLHRTTYSPHARG